MMFSDIRRKIQKSDNSMHEHGSISLAIVGEEIRIASLSANVISADDAALQKLVGSPLASIVSTADVERLSAGLQKAHSRHKHSLKITFTGTPFDGPVILTLKPRAPMDVAKSLHLTWCRTFDGAVEDSLDAVRALDALPIPIVRLRKSGRVLFANTAFTSQLPADSAKPIGVMFHNLIDIAYRHSFRQAHRLALTGEKTNFECTRPQSDGSVRWFQVSLIPQFTPDHQIHGFYLIERDIHQLKLAYQSLHEHEDQLRHMIDSIPTPAAYFSPDLHIEYVNLGFARWMGRARASLLGKKLSDVLPAIALSTITSHLSNALNGEVDSTEMLVAYPSGEKRWKQIFFNPRFNRGKVTGIYFVSSDISDQKLAQERLLLVNQQLASHIENSPLAVIEWDADLIVTRWSPQATRIFGWETGDVLNTAFSTIDISHPDERTSTLSVLESMRMGGKPYAVTTTRNCTRLGRAIWCDWHISCLRDQSGAAISYLALAQDVSSRIDFECQLEFAATHDALTGLPNRTLLETALKELTAGTDANKQQVSVMFIDLDNFKDVNDSLGHSAGDRLINEVVFRIRSVIRSTDLLFRQGGDEFVIAMASHAHSPTVSVVAANVLAAIRGESFLANEHIFLTASIGIAQFPRDGADAEALLRCADAAMYMAKAAGKNTFCYYADSVGKQAAQRVNLAGALKSALERSELTIHYQPIVSVNKNLLIGTEALLRWEHPQRGSIAPGLFIPLAEENGLITEVGDFVLCEVSRQCAAWKREGRPRILASINISPNQLRNAKFVDRAIAIFKESGCDTTWLKMEVTETSAVRDRDQASAALRRLRDLGIEVALDDFGTGYSSLSLIRHLPITTIKIDQSFIRDLDTSPAASSLVAGILGLSLGMGFDVVAEGVETHSQLDFLRLHKCDAYQGHLYSPAISIDRFEALWDRALVPPIRKTFKLHH